MIPYGKKYVELAFAISKSKNNLVELKMWSKQWFVKSFLKLFSNHFFNDFENSMKF